MDISHRVKSIVEKIPQLIGAGLKDSGDHEKYFLSQEAWIRQRVNYLDEVQTLIAKERDLLKKQHDHCREQIIKARMVAANLVKYEAKFSKMCDVAPTLQSNERILDEELEKVNLSLEEIEKKLEVALKKNDDAQRRQGELKAEEIAKTGLTNELLDKVDSLTSKQQTLAFDIKKMERQRDALNEWSVQLDATEASLALKKKEKIIDSNNMSAIPLIPYHTMFAQQITVHHDTPKEEIDY